MRYKYNNKSALNISELATGTWAMGGNRYGSIDRAQAIQTIHTMFDHGVNLIDTAPGYGHGRSEILVGEAIASLPRDEVLIATKCVSMAPSHPTDPLAICGKYHSVLKDCAGSLGRLGCDYIDIYLIHYPDPETPIEETMSALNELKKRGRIRHIGVSNFTKEQIIEAQKYAEIEALQLLFNMVDQGKRELLKWASEQGMITMGYGSMGAGILTGTIRELPNYPKDDIRNTFYTCFKQPKFDNIQILLALMDEIADEHGVPVSQVALNWTSQQNFITTSLCGVRNRQEAIENLRAYDWSLNDTEIERINSKISELDLDK